MDGHSEAISARFCGHEWLLCATMQDNRITTAAIVFPVHWFIMVWGAVIARAECISGSTLSLSQCVVLSPEKQADVVQMLAGFDVPTALTVKTAALGITEACTSERAWGFVGKPHLHIQCRRASKPRDRHRKEANKQTNKQTNSVAFSPQANYTNWATATCRRNLVPNFVDRWVSRGQRGGSLTVVNLSFLDRYFSFK
jgi:hypothetical protein